MIYDCFFSYQHDDLDLVENIAEALENMGLKCWYAPRNVTGRYAKAIAEGISNSKVFILILNHRSAVSEAVLNEVELAHNVSKTTPFAKFQPVCTEKLDMNNPEYNEMMYYIRRMHFINGYDNSNPNYIANEIINANNGILNIEAKIQKSNYIVQDIEDKRLQIQNEILKKFDDDIYQKILNTHTPPSILDVGCGQGDMLISKIGNREISCYIGVDRSSRQIASAKAKHTNHRYHFFEADIEDDSLEEKLNQEMKIKSIEKFDIINISMVLLHLDDPIRLLTRLHKFLADDGHIIIRDIDDGINFASPDPNNEFERIYKMCSNDEQSGNRRTGRNIYSYLYKAGFKNISLEKQGLSSDGMSNEKKEALFNMYFPFTLKNAEIMMNKYPWNNDYKKDYLWYNECFNRIHEEFLKPEFIFSLGFITYTAKK